MASTRLYVIRFCHTLAQFVGCFAGCILRWIFDGHHRGVPPAHDPLLMMSAVELAAKIRKREVFNSPVFYCTAFIFITLQNKCF